MDTEAVPPADQSGRLARDWTRGGILRNLLSLSWPMVLTEGFAVIPMTLDVVWVGRLGPTAIAGVGVASIAVMLAMSAKVGLMAGLRAIVARFVGEGDTAGAIHAAQQALIISIVYGVTTAVVGTVFADEVLGLFGVDAEVVAAGSGYMRVMSAGLFSFSLRIMADSTMQASGDTVTPMRITFLTRSVHMLLAPFIILGWWGFPAVGILGAGIVNVMAHTLAMLIGLWVLFTGRSRLRLTLSGFRADFTMIRRIVRVGIPALVMTAQRSLGYIALTWLMAPFGTVAMAAHSLVQRVDTVLFLPNWALSAGAGVLVGQNLGAREPQRAERSAWLATGLVGAVMAVGCVVLLLWAEGIVGLFNTEPELVATGAGFLRIAAAGYTVMAPVISLSQAIAGAGDTIPAMVISAAMVWVVQVPLAFALPDVAGLGVNGVRWAIVAGTAAGAAAYFAYFRSGRWKYRQV